jgi:ferredoxin-NADP reductase
VAEALRTGTVLASARDGLLAPLLRIQLDRLARYAAACALPPPRLAVAPDGPLLPAYAAALLACAEDTDRGLAALAHRCLQELGRTVPGLAPSLGWRHPYRLRVLRSTASGVLGIRLDLAVPAEHRAAFVFRPGQHVKVFLDVDGVQVARSYSVCVPPAETSATGLLSLGVRRLPDGLVSTYLHEVAAGDEVLVSVPHGNLFAAEDDAPALLLGGGSGVTPLLSIAADLLQRGVGPVGLVVVDRDPEHAMLSPEIDALCGGYADRLTVRRLWTRVAGSARPHASRLGRSIREVLPDAGRARAYLCGPGGLLAAAAAALQQSGVAGDRVQVSAFDTASRARTAALGHRASA